jgi:hypothetical protein
MSRGWLICGVVALMALVGGAGCATIIQGTSQRVSVFATPADSKVTIYDGSGSVISTQQAPCTVSLKRGSGYFSAGEYRVQVEKPGYAPVIVTISGSPGGWYIVGNFFIGGLIGWLVIDPLTGAMWSLHPTTVNANLAPQQSSLPRADAPRFSSSPRSP